MYRPLTASVRRATASPLFPSMMVMAVSYTHLDVYKRQSVNTVAKYVGQLEEHALISTERTDVITRDGLKRNGCLRYTILPIQNAIALYHERQLSALEQTAAQRQAQLRAEKSGVEFVPHDKEQGA